MTEYEQGPFEIKRKENRVPVLSWLPEHEIEPGALRQIENAARHPDADAHIAIMPDVHPGFGVTIGSVFPTGGAVVPNAVGVDIGCFTGDTRIPTLDGQSRSIKELAEQDRPILVYACTLSGKVVAATATAMRTRGQARLVEVELDNGERIRCTPDHQFMLRDGRFREARSLLSGTYLMPLYRDLDRDGYTRVQQNYSGRWQKAHWLVARSGLLREIPRFEGQRTVIHHRDFDGSNNDPSNLQFMGDKAHSRFHRLLVDRNTAWQSPEFEEARTSALAAKAATEEGHAYFAERGTRNILAYMEEHREAFLKSVAGNGERGRGYLTAYNTSEKGRAKSRELASRVFICEHCGTKVKSPVQFHAHHPKVCPAVAHNHKIVAVRWLDELEDVYCLTVPEYHNFALQAGVFVHNCGMTAIQTGLRYDASTMGREFWRTWAGRVQREVPVGFSVHKRRSLDDLGSMATPLRATELNPVMRDKAPVQLGTLGGGNHFMEAQVDQHGIIWLMVHSGSRHTGLRIASHYYKLAVEIDRKHGRPTDDGLSALPLDQQVGQDYIQDHQWARTFARQSRRHMVERMKDALEAMKHGTETVRFIDCAHNYATLEEHGGVPVMVHRKGATSAQRGEEGIIPGTMGSKSYIVQGKGNEDSLNSCSHGAGRKMGRKVAKETITQKQFNAAMERSGSFTKVSMGHIDESPLVYKDVTEVIARQTDLIDILFTLSPLITIKGDSKAKDD